MLCLTHSGSPVAWPRTLVHRHRGLASDAQVPVGALSTACWVRGSSLSGRTRAMANVLLKELVLAGRANDAEGCKCAPPGVDIYGMDDALSTMSLLDDLKSQDEDTVLAAFKRFRFYWNLGIAVAFLVIVVTFTFSIISPQELVECISENRFKRSRFVCR